jgi:hypothetical protein
MKAAFVLLILAITILLGACGHQWAYTQKDRNTKSLSHSPPPVDFKVQNMGSSIVRYEKIGDKYYGNDGSTMRKSGDTYYFSNGTTAVRIGDTFKYSDGTTGTKIGDTIYNHK